MNLSNAQAVLLELGVTSLPTISDCFSSNNNVYLARDSIFVLEEELACYRKECGVPP